MIDNGGRRLASDPRQIEIAHNKERRLNNNRRSGTDRRNGIERRDSKGFRIMVGLDRRKTFRIRSIVVAHINS